MCRDMANLIRFFIIDSLDSIVVIRSSSTLWSACFKIESFDERDKRRSETHRG